MKTKSATKKNGMAASYNRYKEFEGRQYTGMQIGRTHHWHYDQGDWKEKKITPEKWELTYSTTKRRVGHAPEGSGVPVGTGYHWFILAHQYVEKLNANDYSTQMVGLKFKLAHKRAVNQSWSASIDTRRKNLVKILRALIADLEKEPEQMAPVLFDFNCKGKSYKGTGVPILTACEGGQCQKLDLTLNDEHLGIIRNVDGEWKINEIKSKALINAIGGEIAAWYEEKKNGNPRRALASK